MKSLHKGGEKIRCIPSTIHYPNQKRESLSDQVRSTQKVSEVHSTVQWMEGQISPPSLLTVSPSNYFVWHPCWVSNKPFNSFAMGLFQWSPIVIQSASSGWLLWIYHDVEPQAFDQVDCSIQGWEHCKGAKQAEWIVEWSNDESEKRGPVL